MVASKVKGATPDTQKMCNEMKSEAESRAGRQFQIFYPIMYRDEQQGSAMNYYIKVHVDAADAYVHIRLSTPSGMCKLIGIQDGKTLDDSITPF